jgi:hypothetical protein
MKRVLSIFASILLLASCGSQPKEQKVMAREVPERADDFVFENNLIAGRFYGKALEGNPTSPGIDIWVKLPGALVANEWYAEAVKPGKMATVKDDSDYAYINESYERLQQVVWDVVNLIADGDSYVKAAKQYYVSEMKVSFHDDDVYNYFKNTFPDLFD